MKLDKPFNLTKWIKENKEILKPPVGNKNLYINSGDYIVMIVGGPNARKDYHFNSTEELFYQIEGDILIKIQNENKVVEVPVLEGEMFLLPANIPHSPIRYHNTVGLVIEKKRNPTDKDGLIWYCENCNHKLYESYFHLKNIEKDFLPRFKAFYQSKKLKTCLNCNKVMESDNRYL